MSSGWLSAREQDAWMAFLFTSMMVPAVLDRHTQQLAKISIFDYYVLAHLSEGRDRTRTMSDLAACTSSSLSRLSHVVSKLEKRGWVDRSVSPDDGRVTVARLTPAGWDLVVSIAPDHVAEVRSLVFDVLDDRDVADLDRVSRKILANIDEDHWFFHRDQD